MYAFSKQINQYIGVENYGLKIAGVVLIIVLVVLLELRYDHQTPCAHAAAHE